MRWPWVLGTHGTEVMNMLMTEWNWDDALAVRFEEGLEKGLEEGLERGLEKGMEEGLEKGQEETVKNLLDFGMEAEQISRALKIPLETVLRYSD
jgi:predicted transposase YdaD